MEKYNREEFEEVIVNIGRVTKVVKGGRRFRFTALVVVGNKNGLVGFGFGKAKEVPDAIKKAVDDAFKNIIEVRTKGSTIAHDIEVKYNGKVYLRHDGTDLVLADKLLEKGIPASEIVLAFHAPYKRPWTEFALA